MLVGFSIFLSSVISLLFFRKLAFHVDLVDQPNARKHHSGSVPLVGGLAVFLVLFAYLLFHPEVLGEPYTYLMCSLVLLFVGVVDDLRDISYKIRLFVQLMVSIAMIQFGDVLLGNLGNIIGLGNLVLPLFIAIPVTFVVVVGAINAFNMVDGIDGLLGSLTVITFSSLGILFYLSEHQQNIGYTFSIVLAMLPFIFMNLGIPFGGRFKIFMGDAGSTVIGFTVVWLLVAGSQGDNPAFRPVTGLWVAAVPIIDAAVTIARRIKKGQSPFQADREHLHHIIMRLGFGPRQTLFVICLIASLFASVGILSELYQLPESLMFALFVAIACGYFYLMTRIWRISVKVRKLLNLKKN